MRHHFKSLFLFHVRSGESWRGLGLKDLKVHLVYSPPSPPAHLPAVVSSSACKPLFLKLLPGLPTEFLCQKCSWNGGNEFILNQEDFILARTQVSFH